MHTHIHTQLDGDPAFATSKLCGSGTCSCHFDISVSLPVKYQQCSPYSRDAADFSGKDVVRCGTQGSPTQPLQQEYSSCGCSRPLGYCILLPKSGTNNEMGSCSSNWF